MAPSKTIKKNCDELEMFLNDSPILPSEERRHLSKQLSSSTVEDEHSFHTRRRSSIGSLQHPEILTESDSNSSSSSRVSCRRASIITEIFARSSTSHSFIEQSIRPTFILALVYFQEPQPDIVQLRKILGERLLEIPRFSSIFRLENNVVYCDSIPKETVNLEYHIRCVESIKKYEEVSEMISDASTEWWDARRPLWKFTLITNMKDGRSMLFCKIDHAIGDGVAMLAVLRSLLDDPPKGAVKSFQHRRAMSPSMHWSHKLVCFISGCYAGIIGWAFTSTDPHNNLKIPSDKLVKDATDKTFTQTRVFPLKEIKELKNKLRSSSVNDIMTAVVTIGIRKYLQKTNDPVLSSIDKGIHNLQGMTVINARRVANYDQAVTNLGNDFVGVAFKLPLQYTNEMDAVWKCKSIVDQWKVSPELILQKACSGKLLKILPESVLISATIDNIRKPTCIISNVMGPPFECTIGNYIVDDINFMASSGIGLFIGILSYNQKMRISFATDKLANIDVSMLKACMEQAYDDLQHAIRAEPVEFIEPPDMTPLSAKIIEYFLLPSAIAIIGVIAYSMFFNGS